MPAGRAPGTPVELGQPADQRLQPLALRAARSASSPVLLRGSSGRRPPPAPRPRRAPGRQRHRAGPPARRAVSWRRDEEEVAHPLADVAGVDLDLQVPAAATAGASAGKPSSAAPASRADRLRRGRRRRADSAARSPPRWRGAGRRRAARGARRGPPATTLPPAKKPSPPSRSVTIPPASRTSRMPAPMSHGERRNSKKPS